MPYKDKEQQRKAQNEWVKRKREQVNRSVAKARAERLVYIRSFKEKPCQDCGNSFDPCAMDFHHRQGEKKINTLGNVVNQRWPYEQIDAEIAKCDLLCSNCHRVRHKKIATIEIA